MSRIYDVLVAGSGMAGLMAALTAARSGCSVRLVTEGMGSLAISGGCVDVLGYAGGKALQDPWQGMALLDEQHPYRLLGTDTVKAALDDFRQTLEEAGWPLHWALSSENSPCNSLVPTIMGTLKPTFLLPACTDPTALQRAENVLVASVQGLRDCRPALVVSQLKRYKALADKKFSQLILPSLLGETHRSTSMLDLARLVDRAEGRQWLTVALRPHKGKADVLLLPPICGSRGNRELWQAIEEAIGCPVVEMLSIPPGVGGLRLRAALLQALNKLDFELVENARIIKAETAGKQCTALLSETAGQQHQHRARAFVLATGGILSGGIELAPGSARESIMGIDLPVPEDVSQWSQPEIFGDHIFSRLGITVNSEMRPLDAKGSPLWDNVFFAGRSVGHYDFATEKSGHGVAVSTGWQAGRMAVRSVRGEANEH